MFTVRGMHTCSFTRNLRWEWDLGVNTPEGETKSCIWRQILQLEKFIDFPTRLMEGKMSLLCWGTWGIQLPTFAQLELTNHVYCAPTMLKGLRSVPTPEFFKVNFSLYLFYLFLVSLEPVRSISFKKTGKGNTTITISLFTFLLFGDIYSSMWNNGVLFTLYTHFYYKQYFKTTFSDKLITLRKL